MRAIKNTCDSYCQLLTPIHQILIILTLIPHVPNLFPVFPSFSSWLPIFPPWFPAFLSFPSFGSTILHSGFYKEHIPRIPNIPTPISRIPTLITYITTMISRIPTLILCIPIIPLIPFPDSQFRLLQIADSLIFFDVGYKVKKTLKISI